MELSSFRKMFCLISVFLIPIGFFMFYSAAMRSHYFSWTDPSVPYSTQGLIGALMFTSGLALLGASLLIQYMVEPEMAEKPEKKTAPSRPWAWSEIDRYYQCPNCGYILPKKDALISSLDAIRRVNCPKCEKLITYTP